MYIYICSVICTYIYVVSYIVHNSLPSLYVYNEGNELCISMETHKICNYLVFISKAEMSVDNLTHQM